MSCFLLLVKRLCFMFSFSFFVLFVSRFIQKLLTSFLWILLDAWAKEEASTSWNESWGRNMTYKPDSKKVGTLCTNKILKMSSSFLIFCQLKTVDNISNISCLTSSTLIIFVNICYCHDSVSCWCVLIYFDMCLFMCFSVSCEFLPLCVSPFVTSPVLFPPHLFLILSLVCLCV